MPCEKSDIHTYGYEDEIPGRSHPRHECDDSMDRRDEKGQSIIHAIGQVIYLWHYSSNEDEKSEYRESLSESYHILPVDILPHAALGNFIVSKELPAGMLGELLGIATETATYATSLSIMLASFRAKVPGFE